MRSRALGVGLGVASQQRTGAWWGRESSFSLSQRNHRWYLNRTVLSRSSFAKP